MEFQKGLIFHVYNQGNNRQPIFFKERNYPFFLKKMETYLHPYADVLCYCLMPNHFHWLLYIKEIELPISRDKTRTLNQSIGILLRTYARAIHVQEGTSGSLFREGTKAKNGVIEGIVTVEGPNAQHFFKYGNEYALQCFQYIHRNPVKAGLVENPEDWPYSSAPEYANSQKRLCNLELGKKLLLGL